MRLAGWILGIALIGSVAGAAKPVLELTVGDESYVGRAVAHNDAVCWLAHSDGRLSEVALQSVSAFRQTGDQFESLTSLEARNELREQLGREWEIVGTGHYLVAAGPGRAREHAEHFENLYRSFRSYFSRRGFRLPEPDFPLIAVVFANQREFAKQCRTDQVPFIPELKGYYHRKTNRISLFEQVGQVAWQDRLPTDTPSTHTMPTSRLLSEAEFIADSKPGFSKGWHLDRQRTGSGNRVLKLDFVDANIQGSLQNTIVHEATHQVAFNLGLHSRVGQPPRWTVEGLATMFEAEGTRQNTGGKLARGRVNEEQFWWFGLYREQRRKQGSLAQFVATENTLKRSPLDFYAQAWALTFFLAETRPREYAEFLKTIAARDPLKDYSARERIADFQATFGSDFARLEVEMLRFLDDLK